MASGLGNLRSILLSYRDRSPRLYHSRPRSRKAEPVSTGRATSLASLLVLAILAWSRAAVAAPHAPACSPEGGEPVHVAGIDDDWGVRLADGRVVRLAGVDPVAATDQHPGAAIEARGKLTRWLEGRDATLVPLAEGEDRWGRTAGLLFAPVGEGGATPLSVAQAMVDAGLARGRPEPGFAACWPALAAAEAVARGTGLGLWGDPYYAVRMVGASAPPLDPAGSMVLVEGRVRRVGQGRSRVFIGLGAGEDEITVSVARRDLFILRQAGLDDTRLKGVTLRVRGDLEDRDGEPTIDATDAGAIEVVGAGQSLAPGDMDGVAR